MDLLDHVLRIEAGLLGNEIDDFAGFGVQRFGPGVVAFRAFGDVPGADYGELYEELGVEVAVGFSYLACG